MNFIEHILEPRRLLLVWQGPEGTMRVRRTVGELVKQTDEQVRFRYLTDQPDFRIAIEEGFINFPAFRKLDHAYDLGVVDTFMRRLPPRSRGDYGQYLEQFRLRPDMRISDFALLAYTGAKLPSDGFSIINPLDDVVGENDLLIEVAGFRHNSEIAPSELVLGEAASFVAEPANPHDSNAVAIHVRNHKIGYVPRQQANAFRTFFSRLSVAARIERINGRPDRPLIYLLVELRPATATAVFAL